MADWNAQGVRDSGRTLLTFPKPRPVWPPTHRLLERGNSMLSPEARHLYLKLRRLHRH